MRRILALTLSVLTGVTAFAQRGDKPGETQREVVPPGQIPPAPVLTPEEQLKTFKLPEGFTVELVAAEPLVTSPVTIQFDHRGRLWVVEMNGYMRDLAGSTELEPTGNVAILEDTDGDGRMDRRTVFMDRLVMPRALMLCRDGALVAEPPRLWFARDTDGDGRADQKTVVADDYAMQNDPKLGARSSPEHASNSPTWALDNWIYSANHTTRYRNTDGTWRSEPTIFRGQWGLTQDDFGRLYFNSNSDQLRADLIPSVYFARNGNLRQPFGVNVQLVKDQATWPSRVNPGVNRGYQPGQLRPDGRLATFTGACGPVVYRGDQFPEEYRGNVFLSEPTANFIRRNRILDTEGLLAATNACGQSEFLTSTDERFRPVNLFNGPDGCLYVVDMARGLIQHHIYVTSYLRRQTESRKLQSPVDLGRIYRVVSTARPRTNPVLPESPTNDQLLERLHHANGWWRDTAQRLLVERRDPVVVPGLRAAVADSHLSELGRLHALWTLEGLDQLDVPTIAGALNDSSVKVRSAALRLSERFFKGPQRQEAITAVLKHAGFVPLEEQLQLFLTLGEIDTPAADAIIKILLMNAPANSVASRLRFDAALSGLGGRELEFLESLVLDPACAAMKAGHAMLLQGLARCIAFDARPDRVTHLLELTANCKPGEWQQLSLLDGMISTLPSATRNQPAPVIRPIEFDAEPRTLAELEAGGRAELTNRLARLRPLFSWPGKAGAIPRPAAPPMTADEATSFARGKELYTTLCGACHQPHGNGQEGLAPPLVDSEWALGPEKRLVRIVLHGLRDPITVKGRIYELNMPAFGPVLDDQQIADALTYLRREWGHTAVPVKAATVQSIRAETAAREDSWTEAELLRIR